MSDNGSYHPDDYEYSEASSGSRRASSDNMDLDHDMLEDTSDWEDQDEDLAVSTKALDDVTKEMVLEAIALAQTQLPDPDAIQFAPLGPKFTLSVLDMHPDTRLACGITHSDPLILHIDVSKGYKRSSPMPLITVTEGMDGQMTTSERPNPRFSIGIQLVSSVQRFVMERWAKKDESFLLDLYARATERLANCGNVCMLCDRELAFPGLKPTVCDEKLCSYQLEKLGIGAGLSLIDTDVVVADFLICACLAAASSGARLPFALSSMPSEDGKDQVIRADEIVKALASTPNLSTLPHNEEARVAALKEAHPLLPTIIRWIFATNRAHVVSLPENQLFAEMCTPYQFRISTSTRTHAAAFESMKQRHGSFYAWHGSSMANWHNILRNNLKNASGTAMMSAGQAYGPGIYLAKNSLTSVAYTGTAASHTRFWNSCFDASPRVLALCEVANAPQVQDHRNTGIITAANESCVTLRYLFIYTLSQPPSVAAETLKPKMYRNETTITGLNPVSEIDPKFLLVTSDNYAWDIQELVQLIESKHGLFINGYTQLGFTNTDVQAIIRHPSGEGTRLTRLEMENTALRRVIPTHVFAKLHEVGLICKAEIGEDYSRSTAAIIELKSFIEALPAHIKNALEKAPFEVVDSHSRLPFRDTVMHEIELVTSAGDCIHRFGDFLSQVRA